MDELHTTAAVQEHLDEWANVRRDSSADPIICALPARAVQRLQVLCAKLLHSLSPAKGQRGPLGRVRCVTRNQLGGIVQVLVAKLDVPRRFNPAP
jgi:hypothetical protein